MAMTPQAVIITTTSKFKRGGYADFANDGQFDGATETIVNTWEFHSSLGDLEDSDWYWNATTSKFQNTPV